jgi:predicted nucleic acid-binding protein
MPDVIWENKIVAISNTGPLISAFQCRRIDLLKRYFSLIYITASELKELEKHGWLREVQTLINERLIIVIKHLTKLEKDSSIQIAEKIAKDSASGNTDWQEHLPEAEAIAIMTQMSNLWADVIFLDEKSARNIANELNLPVIGFPGLLLRAGLDGLLTQNEIRQILKTCQQYGTHYSNNLIETIIKIMESDQK